MVRHISLNHVPLHVRRLYFQLMLNSLLVYIPTGLCTATIAKVLGHLHYQVRSIYLVSWEYAIIDVVPRDYTTIPLIQQREHMQYHSNGTKLFVAFTALANSVKPQLVLDFAYALCHGMCPGGWMDIDYLCFNPKWKPANSDHRFCIQRAGSRSL